MPERDVVEAAHRDAAEGKSSSTQAGEFVRREFEHVREGKHGVRNPKQAIAIGLSKARRAGVDLPAPKSGSTKFRRQSKRDSQRGAQHPNAKPSSKRSRSTSRALRREGRSGASHSAIAKQARSSARRRGRRSRQASARKAVRTRRG